MGSEDLRNTLTLLFKAEWPTGVTKQTLNTELGRIYWLLWS